MEYIIVAFVILGLAIVYGLFVGLASLIGYIAAFIFVFCIVMDFLFVPIREYNKKRVASGKLIDAKKNMAYTFLYYTTYVLMCFAVPGYWGIVAGSYVENKILEEENVKQKREQERKEKELEREREKKEEDGAVKAFLKKKASGWIKEL